MNHGNLTLIILAFAIMIIISRACELPYSDVELNQNKVDLVNEKINELIKSDVYIEASSEKRKKLVSDMLKKLECCQYIEHLYYDNKTDLFSFQYVDGTLGGIKIEDFSEQTYELPLN